jgi:hypothetical protein
MGPDQVLYASDMLDTAKAVDPATSRTYDDTVPMLKAISWFSDEDRWKVFEDNTRRLCTRVRF